MPGEREQIKSKIKVKSRSGGADKITSKSMSMKEGGGSDGSGGLPGKSRYTATLTLKVEDFAKTSATNPLHVADDPLHAATGSL